MDEQKNNLPIISLSAFEAPHSVKKETKKLHNICLKHGFFYLKDHGISPQLIKATLNASRHFFNLPNDVKCQYDHSMQSVYPKTSRGYIPLLGETLHAKEGADPKEIFDLGFERPESDKPFTGPNILPDDSICPHFATAHYALQQEIMSKVAPKLLQALAQALGEETSFFDPYFTEPTLIQRVIYYRGGYSSAGKHTDNGIFTILIQEELPAPSLRVQSQNEGEWIDVPCLENTFVINLGDMLQHWTNGLFVSTPHEVKHTLATSRLSLPFFVYPNIETVFSPLGTDKCVSVKKVMLENFSSIWVTGKGAGRAGELN